MTRPLQSRNRLPGSAAAADRRVLLLDVVTAFGAQDDPAASLAVEVANVCAVRRGPPAGGDRHRHRHRTDPQQRSRQIATSGSRHAVDAVAPAAVALAHQRLPPSYPHLNANGRPC
ncbi:hypothetical protein M8494_20000 [Serratia ureilytica]